MNKLEKEIGKNMIRIRISGYTGKGKSTIALLIKNTLENHGFKNVNIDLGVGDDETKVKQNLDKKIDCIKDKLEYIDIIESQMYYNSTEKKYKEIINY